MIQQIINSPRVRDTIDSLPVNNRIVQFLRVLLKSILFRKRMILNHHIVFGGVEEISCRRNFGLGNGKNEVLVETLFTAISPGTERGYYLELPNFHQPRPYHPGYSGCGRVRTKGRVVVALKKGDLVAGIFKHSSANILAGDQVVIVPPGVEPLYASFVTLGVIALTGIRSAGIEDGQKIIVMGQGILGQLVNQLARIEGARTVIAIALSEIKKDIAVKSGVDEFIALNQYQDELSSISADVVIDITGSLKGFENALEIVKPGGRVVLLGSIPGYSHESNWAEKVIRKQIEVRGSHVRNLEVEGFTYEDEARRFLQLLADKKLDMKPLITYIYKPEKAPEIYECLANNEKNMVGVVIDWGGDYVSG